MAVTETAPPGLKRGGGDGAVDFDIDAVHDSALPVTNRLGGDSAMAVPNAAPPLPKRGCGEGTVLSDASFSGLSRGGGKGAAIDHQGNRGGGCGDGADEEIKNKAGEKQGIVSKRKSGERGRRVERRSSVMVECVKSMAAPAIYRTPPESLVGDSPFRDCVGEESALSSSTTLPIRRYKKRSSSLSRHKNAKKNKNTYFTFHLPSPPSITNEVADTQPPRQRDETKQSVCRKLD